MENNKQETLEESAESKWSLEKAQEFAIDKFRSKHKTGIVTWESILEVLKVGVLTGHKFGTKYQAERMYSEEDMKQFAFECVGKFISNDDNKVEIKLVDVIIDRLNKHFEQFKK